MALLNRTVMVATTLQVHLYTLTSILQPPYQGVSVKHEHLSARDDGWTAGSIAHTLGTCNGYRSDGVTLIGFDSFLQITLVVETLSFFTNTCSIEQLTILAYHVNILWSLLG